MQSNGSTKSYVYETIGQGFRFGNKDNLYSIMSIDYGTRNLAWSVIMDRFDECPSGLTSWMETAVQLFNDYLGFKNCMLRHVREYEKVEMRAQRLFDELTENKKLVAATNYQNLVASFAEFVRALNAFGSINISLLSNILWIGQMPSCCICLEPMTTKSIFRTSCEHLFHHQCLLEWITYNPGEKIVKAKSKCPVCFSSLVGTPGLPALDVNSLNIDDQVYGKCRECDVIFSSNDSISGCSVRDPIPPSLCDDCERAAQKKMFECPKCRIQLEHSGGCQLFACCLYGRDRCRGIGCDHGSSENIKFCGHKFEVEREHLCKDQGGPGLFLP